MSDRGDHHSAQLRGVNAGVGKSFLRGVECHIHHGDLRPGTVPGHNPSALPDPLVGGIDPLADLLVVDHHIRAMDAESQNGCT